MELIESKTFYNLAKSFAGECQAYVRYKFMEYGARKEGYEALSNEIDKLAYQEFNHARMFYTFLQKASDKTISNIDISAGYPFKEKWDLTENLKLSSDSELSEAERIYPEYSKIAQKEGFKDIAKLFLDVAEVEKTHHKILFDMHEQMKNKTMYKKPDKVTWKCDACGHSEVSKEAWKKCPLCESKQGFTLLKITEY